ncbi:MAG TPA: tail fiber protein [Pyrinomonadaceae bacterium]|nr:tail fiber protein [Pyrinomonadaceae bacterium]
MSDPFVAEIRIFGFNFAPTGWAQCNGQLLPLSQNTALFSLLGTMYGGDGKSTFALPNLQDSVPIQTGQGSGLSDYFEGQQGGSEFITLLTSEMPVHTHSWEANAAPATLNSPDNGRSLARSSGGNAYKANQAPDSQMAFQALAPAGGSLPHNNLQPYLVLNFCIAMQGVFPARP